MAIYITNNYYMGDYYKTLFVVQYCFLSLNGANTCTLLL